MDFPSISPDFPLRVQVLEFQLYNRPSLGVALRVQLPKFFSSECREKMSKRWICQRHCSGSLAGSLLVADIVQDLEKDMILHSATGAVHASSEPRPDSLSDLLHIDSFGVVLIDHFLGNGTER